MDRLTTAVVPSHDVLPAHLRQRTEQARLRAARGAIHALDAHCDALRAAAAAFEGLVRDGACCSSPLLRGLLAEALAPDHVAVELLQNLKGMTHERYLLWPASAMAKQWVGQHCQHQNPPACGSPQQEAWHAWWPGAG